MKLQELNILRKISEGEEEGLRQLFDLHYDSLCIYALKFLDSFDKAEDIVQEVFISFWENNRADQINGGLGNYLVKAVKNNCLYYLRQSKRYSHETVDALYDLEIEEYEESTEMEEKKERLLEELTKLSPQARAVFEGIVSDNRKYKEVAEDLGISVNTVKTTYSRARKRLRRSVSSMVWFLIP